MTRPEGQQKALVEKLHAAGFEPVVQSSLVIEPLPLTPEDEHKLININEYQVVFFVSTNAVRFALTVLDAYWPQWPVGVNWLAVGDATAKALKQAGFQPQWPASGFNSEAALAMPDLQQMEHQKVLILRGETGRELFTDTLRERGATVERVPLYRRRCNPLLTWPEPAPDAVMVTSVESWHCIQQCGTDALHHSLIIAGSERIGEAIKTMGYQHVAVAESPHDEDMVACLKKHQTIKITK
ncbi:MAG TPA: uroporphyrinogen-III synthase [Alcanivoracaceae bacterium]|nr:uroporphyrinogen-III synthase [Alcanivoracaceae bacterium]